MGDASKAGRFGRARRDAFGTVLARGTACGGETSGPEVLHNYREYQNNLNALKEDLNPGLRRGFLSWEFTDNDTATQCWNKGRSSSKTLYEMTAEVKLLAAEQGVIHRYVHVSGKRMIAAQIDGLSRGDLEGGVMAGHSMLDYLPLHRGAMELAPGPRSFHGSNRGWKTIGLSR